MDFQNDASLEKIYENKYLKKNCYKNVSLFFKILNGVLPFENRKSVLV